MGGWFSERYVFKEKDALKYCSFEGRQMKDEKYPKSEDERSRERLRRRKTGEKKYEETQKEEKKMIQKDKILDEEEDEEKEEEEEDEYANYSKKET
jgi:hypothetical protein